MPSHAVLDTPPQAALAFPAGIDPVRFEVLRHTTDVAARDISVAGAREG